MVKKIIFASLFIAIGITAIILSAVCLGDTGRDFVFDKTYGADFYTDTQRAVAAVANNAAEIVVLLCEGFGYSLLIAGCVLIAKGAKDVVFAITDKKTEVQM